MKASDRMILLALPLLALVVAFWVLVLSPKREEATELGDEVSRLESEVSQLRQAADFAEEARREFPSDYRKVVTLGKAVPEDDDTASLFAQLTGISARAEVQFRALRLSEDEVAATTPATEATAEEAPPAADSTASEPQPASSAPATETAAASLPIGATVGPAGLPVMPYELQFQGDFFRVADFVKGVNGTVSTEGGQVSVHGRLMTIDGFALQQDAQNGFPSLLASFAVTTYVTPATEGLTGGATPAGPTSPGTAAPTPTSSTEATP